MNIAIHTNSLDDRGCGKAAFDYAEALQSELGHNVSLYSSSRLNNESADKCKSKFKVRHYDIRIGSPENNALIKKELERFVDEDKIDFMHLTKSGDDDGITPTNCKTGIHCVFTMAHPHGSVYAGVSEYMAKKFNQPLYVPSIIRAMPCTHDYRKQYNIPSDALVMGRHGGRGTFDLPFVKQAIIKILEYRKDIWFLFKNTDRFIDHERVIHLPWMPEEQDIYNFIHACDAMIHARSDGETFGMAVGEFSVCNKPVVTWSGKGYKLYDTSHLDLLGKKAIIYNDYSEILNTLYSLQVADIKKRSWDVYSEKFSTKSIVEQYKNVFLS